MKKHLVNVQNDANFIHLNPYNTSQALPYNKREKGVGGRNTKFCR